MHLIGVLKEVGRVQRWFCNMRQFVKTVIVSQFIDKEAFSNEITKQYETIDD